MWHTLRTVLSDREHSDMTLPPQGDLSTLEKQLWKGSGVAKHCGEQVAVSDCTGGPNESFSAYTLATVLESKVGKPGMVATAWGGRGR